MMNNNTVTEAKNSASLSAESITSTNENNTLINSSKDKKIINFKTDEKSNKKTDRKINKIIVLYHGSPAFSRFPT